MLDSDNKGNRTVKNAGKGLFHVMCFLFSSGLTLSLSVQANEIPGLGNVRYGPNGYYVTPETYEHSLQPAIDALWQVARIQHPGVTTKDEIASIYSTFESSLQSAAQEFNIGEPLRAGWVSGLLSSYTSSAHTMVQPVRSKSLDEALMARVKLIRLTDQKTVQRIERKIKRYSQSAIQPDFQYVGDFDPRRF